MYHRTSVRTAAQKSLLAHAFALTAAITFNYHKLLIALILSFIIDSVIIDALIFFVMVRFKHIFIFERKNIKNSYYFTEH